MRFLVDECAGPAVARWLRDRQHDVFSVFEQARGVDDDWVIRKSIDEDWILITADKDFGEMVYRRGSAHKGIILLRTDDERASTKIAVLEQLLARHSHQLANQFVVVSETKVRFARR